MANANLSPRQVHPALAAVYDSVGPQLDAFYKDRSFRSSYQALDIDTFANAFNTFTEKITAYNTFHRRERRLWSLRIGKGDIPSDREIWCLSVKWNRIQSIVSSTAIFKYSN